MNATLKNYMPFLVVSRYQGALAREHESHDAEGNSLPDW